MAFDKFTKDPDSVLDFRADWTAWLEASGDTIASSEWILPDGITESEDHASSFTDTVAIVWLAGGTLGKTYNIVNRITTAAGRVNDHTLSIVMKAT